MLVSLLLASFFSQERVFGPIMIYWFLPLAAGEIPVLVSLLLPLSNRQPDRVSPPYSHRFAGSLAAVSGWDSGACLPGLLLASFFSQETRGLCSFMDFLVPPLLSWIPGCVLVLVSLLALVSCTVEVMKESNERQECGRQLHEF